MRHVFAVLSGLSANRKLARNGFWEVRQISNDKSACHHRSGMGIVLSLTLRRVSFRVLIQSPSPSSREQTVPSAPERELLLQ